MAAVSEVVNEQINKFQKSSGQSLAYADSGAGGETTLTSLCHGKDRRCSRILEWKINITHSPDFYSDGAQSDVRYHEEDYWKIEIHSGVRRRLGIQQIY